MNNIQNTGLLKLLSSKFKTAIRLGLKRVILGQAQKLQYVALQYYFDFDEWHATNPYFSRPYKRHVVQLVNSLSPRSVAEIGCGLGDVLVRIQAGQRLGIDADPNVIRAAQFLHKRKAEWECGDISSARGILQQSKVDCLIMVGWLHMLSPNEVYKHLSEFMSLTSYMIVDAFNDPLPEGCYRHDFSFLDDYGRLISKSTPDNDTIRTYFVYKSINAS